MGSDGKWARVRFHANFDDSRPVIFPPPGPYWETGYAADESYATVVAYFPTGREAELETYWPDASEVDWHSVDNSPIFTDRFQCPKWWDEEKQQPKGSSHGK